MKRHTVRIPCRQSRDERQLSCSLAVVHTSSRCDHQGGTRLQGRQGSQSAHQVSRVHPRLLAAGSHPGQQQQALAGTALATPGVMLRLLFCISRLVGK